MAIDMVPTYLASRRANVAPLPASATATTRSSATPTAHPRSTTHPCTRKSAHLQHPCRRGCG
eukprot:5828556-Prorocentrum_lima.AAC.1